MARSRVAPLLVLAAATACAPHIQRGERFYYPGSFNWRFLAAYPEAGRLFNAFDYGHAVQYEVLWREGAAGVPRLEGREFDYITRELLVRPPRFAVAEEAVSPRYAQAAWRAQAMFHWAHVLHRQIYDVYADDRIPWARKDALVERLTDAYLADRRYAFVAVPKTMALMDDQPYSQVFRRDAPKFNGLIWAYHWLQVGVYDALLADSTAGGARENVAFTLERFRAMLDAAPAKMPRVMPMSPAIAPAFTARHPRAAAIFDNLHMMHDIIADILLSPAGPRDGRTAAIHRALDAFQDGTRDLEDPTHWLMMADHMGGLGAMGGSPLRPR
jgi:hypothetical protein